MPRLSKTRKKLLTTMMKESIFEAATSVLCEHGVDGTTMNRVAAVAKVAKSSLYDYFENKEELLDFVTQRIVVPFLETVEQIARTDQTAPKKLEAILRTAYDYSTRHKVIIRLVAESDQSSGKSRPRILELFKTIFEQGVEDGSFRPHNSAHVGRMFAGCLSELFELQATNDSQEDAREYVDMLIDATLNGFCIHAEKAPAPDGARQNSPHPEP